MTKMLFPFGCGEVGIDEYHLEDPLVSLGSKGFGLQQMVKLGLAVPPGFTITTEACRRYLDEPSFQPQFERILLDGLRQLEAACSKTFKAGALMVSVRSGAATSMPGMLDTHLNLNYIEDILTCTRAVIESWDSEKARAYRRIAGVSDDLCTAVTIQQMVFGNRGPNCGTGVFFTRHPATGERKLYGEYLLNAQGKQLVDGSKTPLELSGLFSDIPTSKADIEQTAAILENHFKDMQDVEFTIEDGNFYVLQTRTAKRTAKASVKIAVDLCEEGLISREVAIGRVDFGAYAVKASVDKAHSVPIAQGIPASPGAVAGRIRFAERIRFQKRVDMLQGQDFTDRLSNSDPFILVSDETTTDDIEAMAVSAGILTKIGGSTSHAATVARGMNKPCIAGCGSIVIDLTKGTLTIGDIVLPERSYITIDGATGEVFKGPVQLSSPELDRDFKTLLEWKREGRN